MKHFVTTIICGMVLLVFLALIFRITRPYDMTSDFARPEEVSPVKTKHKN